MTEEAESQVTEGSEDTPPGHTPPADLLPEDLMPGATAPEDVLPEELMPEATAPEEAPPLEAAPPEPDDSLEAQALATAPIVPFPRPGPDIVRRENQLAGSRDWRISRGANRKEIEGYALVATVTPGQRVPVAVNVPQACTW